MANNINPELTKVLDQLKDIHYPDTPILWPLNEVLWWPPSPGVIMIIAIICLFIILAIKKLITKIRMHYKNKAIYLALQELIIIEQNINELDPINCVRDISILLKRCALIKYKDKNIQSLTGKNWLVFLNETGDTEEFTAPNGQLIATIPYLNNIDHKLYPKEQLKQQIKSLIEISKKWIKKNL